MNVVPDTPQSVPDSERHPLDAGIKYYSDKIKTARELGYDSIVLAIHDMWDHKKMSHTHIGKTFEMGYSGIRRIINLLPHNRIDPKGGRRGAKRNDLGIFNHWDSGHQFTAGEVDLQDDGKSKYKTIRCTICDAILSEDWLCRDSIFTLIDSHREICRFYRKSTVTADRRTNERGIFVMGNARTLKYVAAYSRGSGMDREYKSIRCCTCRTILPSEDWMSVKESRLLIKSHMNGTCRRKR